MKTKMKATLVGPATFQGHLHWPRVSQPSTCTDSLPQGLSVAPWPRRLGDQLFARACLSGSEDCEGRAGGKEGPPQVALLIFPKPHFPTHSALHHYLPHSTKGAIGQVTHSSAKCMSQSACAHVTSPELRQSQTWELHRLPGSHP